MNDLDLFRHLLQATQPPHPVRLEDLQVSARHFSRRRLTMAGVLAIALIGGLGVIALPAGAGGWVKDIVPHETRSFPFGTNVTYATPSPSHNSISAVEQQVGFVPLLPTALPANCARTKIVVVPAPADAINVVYSCNILVMEQPTRQEQPVVGPNATEQVLVNGKPAVYVSGAWIMGKWEPTFQQQVMFDQDGLFIVVTAALPTNAMTQAQLLDIASSLKPAR